MVFLCLLGISKADYTLRSQLVISESMFQPTMRVHELAGVELSSLQTQSMTLLLSICVLFPMVLTRSLIFCNSSQFFKKFSDFQIIRCWPAGQDFWLLFSGFWKIFDSPFYGERTCWSGFWKKVLEWEDFHAAPHSSTGTPPVGIPVGRVTVGGGICYWKSVSLILAS